jgi:cell division protein FtsL
MKPFRSRRIRLSRTFIAWTGVFALAIALKVWLHLQTTEEGYQLTQLRALAMRLAQEGSELEAELTTLTSPQALDAIARDRLKLHPPRDGQVVMLP